MTAIPIDGGLRPIGAVPELIPDTKSQGLIPAPVSAELEDALAAGDWPRVTEVLGTAPESLLSPIPRVATGHAMLAENHNNEAVTLFASVTQKPALVAWKDWTRELVDRHPTRAAAHYLYGDALARLGHWAEAAAEFTAAVGLDPPFYLAKNARGVVYAAQGMRDEAIIELSDLAAAAPGLADVHANLGAVHVELFRAAEGAKKAYRKALDINGKFALATNGLGCASYALGEWDQARTYFEQAAQQYPDVSIFQVATANVLTILSAQTDFYVSTDPMDLLPPRSSTPGGPMQSAGPSRAADRVAGPTRQPGRVVRQPATTYRPSVPTHRTWTQAHQSYQQQAARMRQQVEMQRMRWETQMRQRYRDIGGITMNMQKALADRGDWPVQTAFGLGYHVQFSAK